MNKTSLVLGAVAGVALLGSGCGRADIDIEGTAVYCIREPETLNTTNLGLFVDVNLTLNVGDENNLEKMGQAYIQLDGYDIYAELFRKTYVGNVPNPAAYAVRAESLSLPGNVDYATLIARGSGAAYAELPLEKVECTTLDEMLAQ